MSTFFKLSACLLVVIFLTQCTGKMEKHIQMNNHSFELKAYLKCENNKLLFSINENDIEAVDWQNQSFKLKKSILDSLRNSDEIYNSFYASYFVLLSNNKIIDTLVFLEMSHSCGVPVYNSPLVCQFKDGVFSKDGWFVIVPYENSQGSYYKQLFNKQIYNKFKQMNLLNSCNWQPCDSNVHVSNLPNKSFFKDFGSKFKNEVILIFGDSLQVDIDAIAYPRIKVNKKGKENI